MKQVIVNGISTNSSVVMLADQTIYESDSDSLSVSDSYHTMDELYEHRYALFCALCKIYDGYITPLGCRVSCFKSKLHFDGTMFDNSFIVFMLIHNGETREQISYHLPMEWWDKFKLMTVDRAPKWDGHESKDVIERLLKL